MTGQRGYPPCHASCVGRDTGLEYSGTLLVFFWTDFVKAFTKTVHSAGQGESGTEMSTEFTPIFLFLLVGDWNCTEHAGRQRRVRAQEGHQGQADALRVGHGSDR